MRRDKAAINLRLICEPVFVGDIREREELLAAAFNVGSAADIRQLFVEFQSAGVDFAGVAWGYATVDALAKTEPVTIFANVGEIRAWLS